MSYVVRLPVSSPLIVGKHIRARTGAGRSYVEGFRDDVEEWMEENEVKHLSMKLSSDCLSFEVTFENEVDAVAFRMRW